MDPSLLPPDLNSTNSTELISTEIFEIDPQTSESLSSVRKVSSDAIATVNHDPLILSRQSEAKNITRTTSSAASVLDPKFDWVAPPELILNCAMESLMPSPGRFMDNDGDTTRFSLTEQFMNGETVKPSILPKVAKKAVDSVITEKKANDKSNFPLPQGAWKTPLSSLPLSSASTPSLKLSSITNWPSLATSFGSKAKQTRKSLVASAVQQVTYKTVACSKQPADDNSTDLQFPWAAKMDPATRNLFKATSPTYMEDGTPKVQIPSHVFLHGLENQKEYVIGQFYQCSTPSGGLIHAVLNKIWGRNGRIFIRKLSDSSYLFHIPDDSTRKWVIQRSLWHVDDCLMFVAPWTPTASLELPVISTVPVWVTLKDIPNQLYSIPGISWIASGLGAPMATYKPRLDPFLMGEAKILVEVELIKQFPQKIALEDKNGDISLVKVEYSWIPSTCGICGHLGHKEARCLQQGPIQKSCGSNQVKTPQAPVVSTSTSLSSSFNDFTVKEVAVSPAHPVSLPLVVSDMNELPNATLPMTVVAPAMEYADVATEQAAFGCGSSVCASLDSPIKSNISASKTIALNSVSTRKDDLVTAASLASDANISQDLLTLPSKTSTVTSLQGTMTLPTVIAGTLGLENNREEGHEVATMGNNTFAVLESYDEDINSDEDSHLSENLLTVSAQRILRDRPVKPSQKYQDMLYTPSGGGRGNRGRGGRQGRGGRA